MTPFPSVDSLLPHSRPMILIDEVVSREGNQVVGRVTLRPDSPFVVAGRAPSTIAIEYMAQSIGLLTGLTSIDKGNPIQVGYLLGTRDLRLDVDFFEVGDELLVHVDWIFGEDELGAFRCEIERRGQIVASAILNVFKNREHKLPGRENP